MTADAQGEGNPPPLPPPHVEVLRWYVRAPSRRGWYAVDAGGDVWHWWLSREWAQWGDAARIEARIRLAAEVIALRARVEQTTTLYRKLATAVFEGHPVELEFVDDVQSLTLQRELAARRVDELTVLLTEAKPDVLRGDLLRCEAEKRQHLMATDLSTRINKALLVGAAKG